MSCLPTESQYCQYIFGDFLLRVDGVLLHKNKELHIPPKELSVFIMLLKAGGKVVTKEEIFETVWHRNAASDESLTRCIYALRKILREDRHCRLIETVYGKGYRFKAQVAVVCNNEPTEVTTSVALFPFATDTLIDENLLHHGLIQSLSRYSCLGLNVLPASATQDCRNFEAVNHLIAQLQPDFYITGKAITSGDNIRVFIELVRSKDHRLIEHHSLDYEKGSQFSVISTRIINLIVDKLPHINLSKDTGVHHADSFDSALTCLNGRRELLKFTPESINKALAMFQVCINEKPTSPQPYTHIAECYISLAQLGLYDHSVAVETAVKAIDKSIELDPSNAQSLSLLGLITGLKGDKSVADVLFKQAHLLMPSSPDVNYYHGLYYFMRSETQYALQSLENCLEMNPGRISALILKLWLTYYCSSPENAYNIAKNIINETSECNPIIVSMGALFAALSGKHQMSEKYINSLDTQCENGYMAVNILYTKYILYGRAHKTEIIKFLQKTDYNKMKGSLLPLILIAYGRTAMQKHLDVLKKENNIWSNIWLHDPRLAGREYIVTSGKENEKAA